MTNKNFNSSVSVAAPTETSNEEIQALEAKAVDALLKSKGLSKKDDDFLEKCILSIGSSSSVFYSSKKPTLTTKIIRCREYADNSDDAKNIQNQDIKFMNNQLKKYEQKVEDEQIRIATTAGLGFEIKDPELYLFMIVSRKKMDEILERRDRSRARMPQYLQPLKERLKVFKRVKRRKRDEIQRASQPKPLRKRLEEYKARKYAKLQITGAENE
jgi:hypothetical protein